MTRPKNIWEAEARGRKASALIRAVDSELREHVRGHEKPDSIAKFLRAQSLEWWADLAKRHGIKPPSALTTAVVCLEYEARAEEDADAAPELDLEELTQW